MKLRSYQVKADQSIVEAWKKHKNILYVAPCRSGKTVQMANCIRNNVGGSVVIAHRAELVSQMSMTLARNGIKHRIIGPKALSMSCSKRHTQDLGQSFIDENSSVVCASVDTLIRMDTTDPWFKSVTLWITDEAHHVVNKNKWGQATEMFPNARGLGVTATPTRADGKGLGKHADGVFEVMIIGPHMRELIDSGHISEYKIYAPECNIDLSQVPISANGDFSPIPLANAVHKSRIVGDIVQSYIKIANGKIGMTFAVDIESATEIALAYKAAGVTAEVVSSNTNSELRRDIMRRHQKGEIKQVVNVDLFGEGTDIQMLEVVSMGRPTESYGLFVQQFCRPLNPDPLKQYGIIIDHVGNCMRHGLPDGIRVWTLDRKEKRSNSGLVEGIPVTSCQMCTGVYEKTHTVCPYCGYKNEPQSRSSPQAVDGDLMEMSPELLARLRGVALRVEGSPSIPYNASPVIINSIKKRFRELQEAQKDLRETMSIYGGWQESLGRESSEIQRRFFFAFGIDVLSAQGLGTKEAKELEIKIKKLLTDSSISV